MTSAIDLAQAHSVMVSLARGGPGIPDNVSLAAFVMLVLRDEQTGERVDVQQYHLDLVDALTRYKRLVVDAHIESGKTQIGAMWALWELGRDLRLRIAVGSETLSLAVDIVSLCARYIEDEGFDGCVALREVFPKLLPGDDWRPREGAISVKRPGGIKDPSMRAFGADSGITGRRVDKALLDDYVTVTTTQTPYLRQQQTDIFFRKVFGRVVDGGSIVFFNNCNWSDDCAAQFMGKPGVHRHVMTVTTDGTETGPSNWPARWPPHRIAEFIAQNPDYKAQLFCVRRQIGEYGRFDRNAVQAALDAGRGRALGARIEHLPHGAMVCIGVDFAFANTRKSDESAIVAVLREPPAKGHRMGRRVLLGVDAGKWDELTAMQRLEQVIGRYPKGRVRIRGESNAGQRWIVQSWTRALGEMIEPYQTTGSKWDPETGIPSLAAAFLNALWVLPSDEHGQAHPAMQELISQMGAFDPSRAGRDHTGDRLMALFFADGLARDLPPPSEARFGFVGESVTPENAAAENRAVAAAAEAARKSGPILQPEDQPIPVRKVESEALWNDMRELLSNRADGRPAY